MNFQDPGTLTGLVEAVVVLLTGYRLVSRAPSIGERVAPRSEHPRLFWAFTLMNLALGLLLLSSVLLLVLPTPLAMYPFGFFYSVLLPSMMIICASNIVAHALVTGKVPVTGGQTIARAEFPLLFWAMVVLVFGLMGVVGLLILTGWLFALLRFL